jgi:hypothetical protein
MSPKTDQLPSNIRIDISGTGEDRTPEITALKSPFMLLYNPFDKTAQVALAQGSVGCNVATDGMAINWASLYAYSWIENQPIKLQGGAYERNAFIYAYEATLRVMEMLKKAKERGQIDEVPSKSGYDPEKWVEVKMEQIEGIKDAVYANLEGQSNMVRTLELRENKGYYRVLGLKSMTKPFASIMRIPKLIMGKNDVILYGSQIPYQPGSDAAITTKYDKQRCAVFAGIVHAMEHQGSYHESCAIRASRLQYTFGDMFTTPTVLTVASRAGFHPRLTSRIAGNGNELAWLSLIAGTMTYEWFKKRYIRDAPNPDPVGDVRYVWSGEGVTALLQNQISRYVQHQNVHFYDKEPATSASGLFFFPASNEPGSSYELDFMRSSAKKADHIEIRPYVGPMNYLDYAPDPLTVQKDGNIILPKEQQLKFEFHPVNFEPVESVLENWKYIGAGLQARMTVIRDRKDTFKEAYQMSRLLNCLALAHSVPYDPQTLIFTTRMGGHCTIKEYEDVDIRLSNVPGVDWSLEKDV